MGSSITFDGPLQIETNKPLQLRYGFYVHSGLLETNALERQWLEFSRTARPNLSGLKR
jgi:hypothetical protein